MARKENGILRECSICETIKYLCDPQKNKKVGFHNSKTNLCRLHKILHTKEKWKLASIYTHMHTTRVRVRVCVWSQKQQNLIIKMLSWSQQKYDCYKICCQLYLHNWFVILGDMGEGRKYWGNNMVSKVSRIKERDSGEGRERGREGGGRSKSNTRIACNLITVYLFIDKVEIIVKSKSIF